MNAEARLSLEGTHRPIVAHVESSRGTALVVGRSLPFLRLGSRVVDQAGRAGSIAHVALRIEDGVPRLSVELSYDLASRDDDPPAVIAPASVAPPRRDRRDPTLGYESRASRPPSVAPPQRLDATNHDSTLGCAPTQPVATELRASLAPMPLPIPELAPQAPQRPRRGMRVPAWLMTLASLIIAWLRPLPLLGAP